MNPPHIPQISLPKHPLTFEEALAHLRGLRQFGFQPGLETTQLLASMLGNPQERLRFIHVAGTNGKGSTCAMLESVYRQTGLKVGLYTSPHLVRFNERIQVNRQPIPDADLARWVGILREQIQQSKTAIEATFFEFTTIIALAWFAEAGCDLVIWETGLGGRLDATNIVLPLASVITNIGFDHQRILGNTLAEIASEKAGILKPCIPATTATQNTDALSVIRYKAQELDCPLITVDRAAAARLEFAIPLSGEHQRINAALAAATVRLLRFVLPVTDEALRFGLEHVHWPGRLQRIQRGRTDWILDGAHNLDGVQTLVDFLETEFRNRRPTLVVGMLADKDWREMLKLLLPHVGRVITAPVDSTRAVSAEELKAACVATGLGRPIRASRTALEALKGAEADPYVVVTGSLYFIGQVLELLGIEAGPTDEQRTLNEWSSPRQKSW